MKINFNGHSSSQRETEMKYPNPSLDTQITIGFYYGKDYVSKTIAIKNLDGYIEDTNYKDLKVLSYNIESNQEEWKLITNEEPQQ